MNSFQEALGGLTTVVAEINESIKGILLQQGLFNDELAKIKSGECTSNGAANRTNGTHNHTNFSHYGRMTKINYPQFHGEDVKGWFIKKYGDNVPWDIYDQEALKRFEVMFEDPMVKLKNLKLDGTVQHYYNLFAALLNRLELNEAYAVSLFNRRLKKEISMLVRMFKVTILTNVYCLAKMQESTILLTKSRYTPFLPTSKASLVNTYADKGNGYVPKPCNSLYTNTGSSYDDALPNNLNEQLNDVVQTKEHVPNNDMVAQIPLNALTGIYNFQTIRVRGVIRKQVVNIFVDCRSTHNFVDLHMAKRIRCRMKPMYPLQVLVANEEAMTSTLMCQGLSVTIGEVTYVIDAIVLPLGACDMVLGIQWLTTLGDIQFNFKKLTGILCG
nr:hypothetical protein [Tanacetum cinerariifolium]